jgi:hypothetical protein
MPDDIDRIPITYRWERDSAGVVLVATAYDPVTGVTERGIARADTETAAAFAETLGAIMEVDLPDELQLALSGYVRDRLRYWREQVPPDGEAEERGTTPE